jgi:asparagine synthase (glutamine-hydrolysing)
MCGIFIVISKNKKLNKQTCINSAKNLYNRGPDILKYNFFFDKKLFISNTVLSITGLTKKNKNLYRSKSKNYAISFNGEIYNYQNLNKSYLNNKLSFDNLTDTEVLVNLYDSVSHNRIPKLLNGMFAYAIYDIKEDKVAIYSDAQGEKSVYYFNDKNYFIISSTIDSILKFIKKYEINTSTLKKYFCTRHFMPLTTTCFKNINLLSNGKKLEFNLKNNNFKIYTYDSPRSWISKKKYEFYKSLTEDEMINYFEKALIKQLSLMIPKVNFGCIASGGIDSTLQAKLISNISKPKINLSINHLGKDKIISNKNYFDKYLYPKISVKKLSESKYTKNVLEAYKIVSSPLHTHDLGGRVEIAKQFKKNNCRVFFSADGCDELFGGQQLYYKLFLRNKKTYKKNYSPYTSVNYNKIFYTDFDIISYKLFLERNWYDVYKKYSFLKKKERNIQSSLFLDYFVQSINVSNRSNDLISCNYSIEPRNVFIQKTILKIIINLPIKYKINFRAKKKMIQKYLLKKLFAKYYNENLIFKKEGFSGFPESLSKKLKDKDLLFVKNLLYIKENIFSKNSKYYDKKNYQRDINWKLINSGIFLKNYIKNVKN